MSGKLSIQSPPFQHVTWEVPNVFELPSEINFCLQSPEFRFAGDDYRLGFYPNGCGIDIGRDFVAIELQNSDRRGISYEFALRTRLGEEIQLISCNTPLTGVVFPIDRNKLVENKDLFIPDDTLTVVCTMRLAGASSEESPKSVEIATLNEEEKEEGLPGVAKLQSDYRQLLQKGVESDACLVVSGKEFPVHRCVLRSRSTVFEAMFSHETTEKESGRVVIKDLDPESFGYFLEYLYTGSVGANLLDDNYLGLYEAADKYDLPTLKSECVSHMLKTLSVDSFCDVMNVALRHSEEYLLTSAVNFFKENLSHIIVTPKWQQFLQDNTTNANELLIKALGPKEQ